MEGITGQRKEFGWDAGNRDKAVITATLSANKGAGRGGMHSRGKGLAPPNRLINLALTASISWTIFPWKMKWPESFAIHSQYNIKCYTLT